MGNLFSNYTLNYFNFQNFNDIEFENFEKVVSKYRESKNIYDIYKNYYPDFILMFSCNSAEFTAENINKIFDILEKHQNITGLSIYIHHNINDFIKRLVDFCKNSGCITLTIYIYNQQTHYNDIRTLCYNLFKNLVYKLHIYCDEISSNNSYLNEMLEKIFNERDQIMLEDLTFGTMVSYVLGLNIALGKTIPVQIVKNFIVKRRKIFQQFQKIINKKILNKKIIANGYILGGKKSLFYTKNVSPQTLHLIENYI